MRKYRKQEHIENYLKATYQGDPLFKDVFIEHYSMPDFAYDDVDTSLNFMDKKISFPLMINAITGGTDFAESINESLAHLAKDFNIPMAVGSQTIALEDSDAIESFKIVREIIGDGLVFGNINGLLGLEDAKRAVDMIQADALQIHLNPAQELIMEEGDRDFSQVRKNIENIVQGLEVPVIVKEVGFGMSPKVVKELYDLGVKYVDIAGFGGTNFFEVENLRYPQEDYSELFNWGNPTALCLLLAKDLKKKDLTLIGSGGIRGAEDCLKALALGSDFCAMSGEILNYLVRGGYDYAHLFLEQLMHKMKILMVLTNCKTIEDIHHTPYRIKGTLKELYRSC